MKKTFKHSKFTAVFTDENGYFSLTGDMDGGSGAVGDKIAEIDSDFAPLAKMHLADCKTGAPMHDWANAEYFAKEGKLDILAKHLRVSDEKALYFSSLLNEIRLARNLHREMWENSPKEIGFVNRVINPLYQKLEDFKAECAEQWKDEAEEAYVMAKTMYPNRSGSFVDPYDEAGDPISEEYETCLDGFSEPEKAIAAAMQEDCDVCDVEEDGEEYTASGRTYRVLTDNEADDAWEASLDNYLEECVYPELPENMKRYFDDDAWKRDAKMDGRGHSLSSYDGNEYDQTVNGTTYYLYRN